MTTLLVLLLAATSGDSVQCVRLGSTAGGLLYLGGNRIDPPYVLSGRCVIGADTTWKGFYINGYEIWRGGEGPTSLRGETSGNTANSRRLRTMLRAPERLKEMSASGRLPYVLSPAAALAVAYRADTAEVDSAIVKGSNFLTIHWHGGPFPESLNVSISDWKPPSPQQVMRNLLGLARLLLGRLGGGVVIVRGGLGSSTSAPLGPRGASWWEAQIDSVLRGVVPREDLFWDPELVRLLRNPDPLPPRGCEP